MGRCGTTDTITHIYSGSIYDFPTSQSRESQPVYMTQNGEVRQPDQQNRVVYPKIFASTASRQQPAADYVLLV